MLNKINIQNIVNGFDRYSKMKFLLNIKLNFKFIILKSLYINNINIINNAIERIFNFVLYFFKSSINPKKKNIDDSKTISKKKFYHLDLIYSLKLIILLKKKLKQIHLI